MDMFSQHDEEKAIWLEYDGTENETGVPAVEDIGIHYLQGDGDFRSEECIDLLKQADIVVTNPPFSLFREYAAQLIEYDKKFLIIGHQNAIKYQDIFPLIKDNKLWLGITPRGKDMLFDVPENYAKELVATKKEGSAYRICRWRRVWPARQRLLVYQYGLPTKARGIDSMEIILARGLSPI